MDNDKEEDAGEDDDEVAGGKDEVRIGIRQTENGCPKRNKTKKAAGGYLGCTREQREKLCCCLRKSCLAATTAATATAAAAVVVQNET